MISFCSRFGSTRSSSLTRLAPISPVMTLPQPFGFSGMTLGHVILAVDRSALAQLRLHEHVHVRQYERWGPLFLPAYLLSSLFQLLRGRNPYLENHFERQAYAVVAARRRMARQASSHG